MTTATDIVAAAIEQTALIQKILRGPVVVPPPTGNWTVEKPVSIGVKGKMLLGMNCQGALPGATAMAKVRDVGFNAIRHGEWRGSAGAPEYYKDSPGNGVEVMLLHPFYGNPDIDQSQPYNKYWTDSTNAVAGHGVILHEIGNEMHYGSGPHDNTGTLSAAYTRQANTVLKALDGRIKIVGPAQLAVYADHGWTDTFFAAKPAIDYFSLHSYYHVSPEDKLMYDELPSIAYVKSKGFTGGFIQSEKGWSGAAPKPGVTATDYGDWKSAAELELEYPRDIFLQRGSGFYASFYFMLHQFSTGKTNSGGDFQNCFGVFNMDWSEQSFVRMIREALAIATQAIGAANYKRANNTWATRMNGLITDTLAIWNKTQVSDKVWVVAKAPTSLSIKPIGAAAVFKPLPAGPTQVTVPLSANATVLSGIGLSFPEFS